LTDEERARTEVIAVSVDPPEQIQMMKDRVMEEYNVEIRYTILTDADHRVIDRYGLFNPDESRRRPVPHPTVLVIDRDGVVQWKFTEINYRIRPENDDILAALRRLQNS
jgi:peroxiredoxin